MVLFADASSLDVRRWTREAGLAGRLLGLGLPLTMLAGAVAALLLVPGLELWQAALVGVILAPTDAALGQAVVSNLRVPAVIRNALNVESGLNDGLALPFVTIFITVGLVATGADTDLDAVETLALALVGSTVIGAATGIAGGWLLRRAAELGTGPAALAADRPRRAGGGDVPRGRRDRGERVPGRLGRGPRGGHGPPARRHGGGVRAVRGAGGRAGSGGLPAPGRGPDRAGDPARHARDVRVRRAQPHGGPHGSRSRW